VVLDALEGAGIPISVAMGRSLQVLMGHLFWVLAGGKILGAGLAPFFDRQNVRFVWGLLSLSPPLAPLLPGSPSASVPYVTSSE
jgi:RsiW-degrading membrane proteinase PrsW (M82 family)